MDASCRNAASAAATAAAAASSAVASWMDRRYGPEQRPTILLPSGKRHDPMGDAA
jgi:hypothetical protein